MYIYNACVSDSLFVCLFVCILVLHSGDGIFGGAGEFYIKWKPEGQYPDVCYTLVADNSATLNVLESWKYRVCIVAVVFVIGIKQIPAQCRPFQFFCITQFFFFFSSTSHNITQTTTTTGVLFRDRGEVRHTVLGGGRRLLDLFHFRSVWWMGPGDQHLEWEHRHDYPWTMGHQERCNWCPGWPLPGDLPIQIQVDSCWRTFWCFDLINSDQI